jgi:hypothetical protein
VPGSLGGSERADVSLRRESARRDIEAEGCGVALARRSRDRFRVVGARRSRTACAQRPRRPVSPRRSCPSRRPRNVPILDRDGFTRRFARSKRARRRGRIAGRESAESAEFTSIRVDSRKDDPTRVDVSAREPVAIGPNKMHSAGGPLTVEDALAVALARASAADQWAVVAQLPRELEARRLSAAGVRSLLDRRGRRPAQE